MGSIARSSASQLRMSVESSFGSPSTMHCTRPDEIPENFGATRTLYDNHVAGHQHPLTRELPEVLAAYVEDMFSATFRIRRSLADGGTPDLVRIFESAGWKAETSTGDTTLTGTPTVSSLEQSANVTGVGQFVLVERSSGVHVPVLVSALSSATITPHVRLSAAPLSGAQVNPMHTLTPTTDTGYEIPAGKTLAFRIQTQGQYEDAIGDLALNAKACALASVGEITLSPNSYPSLACTFNGVPVDMTPTDIAADDFVDSSRFAMVTPDLEFSMQTASSSGDIALVSRAVTEVKINLGISVKGLANEGGDNVGGITGYILIQDAPTIEVTCQFRGDSTFDKKWFTELEGSNTPVCVQVAQPTRNLDVPAFAFCLPNCHIATDGAPKISMAGDIITATAKFVASNAGINSESGIDEVGSSPIYFGFSTEAA